MTPKNNRIANYRINNRKRVVQQPVAHCPQNDGVRSGIEVGGTIWIILFHLFLIYIASMFTISTHYYYKSGDAYRNKDIEKAVRYKAKAEYFRGIVPFY
jgi:hypothetical protein